jgi:hypothetical protein
MIHLTSAEAKLAKQITDEIKDHIKVKPDVVDNQARVFEKIYYLLRTICCTRCGGGVFEIRGK